MARRRSLLKWSRATPPPMVSIKYFCAVGELRCMKLTPVGRVTRMSRGLAANSAIVAEAIAAATLPMRRILTSRLKLVFLALIIASGSLQAQNLADGISAVA